MNSEKPPQGPPRPEEESERGPESPLSDEERTALEGFGVSREDIEGMGPAKARSALEKLQWQPENHPTPEAERKPTEPEAAPEEEPNQKVPLTEAEIETLRNIGENVDLPDVIEYYKSDPQATREYLKRREEDLRRNVPPEIEIPTFVKPKTSKKPEGPSQIKRLGEALRAGARGAKEGWQEKAAERRSAEEETAEKEAPKPTGLRFEFNLLGDAVERIKARQREESEETITERLLNRIQKLRAGIEAKVVKWRESRAKEEIPKVKGTRAERREARRERWEEMSEEERRAVYEKPAARRTREWEELSEEERRQRLEKRYELRERRYRLDAVRADLSVLEDEYLKQRRPSKELEEEYQAAKVAYQEARAEYIGAKAWRMLKERQRMAEEEADAHQAGGFESVRKVWRWLGEQNLEKLLAKYGKQPTSKFGKIAARMVSLRTATSLGLLVGGSVFGLGTAAGVGLLATRRVLSGTSAAFGSYDLMRIVSEKRALALNEQEIQKMELPQLEQKMAEFEARARFSGEKLVRSHDYLALRKEYSRRIEAASEKEKQIAEAIQGLDAKLRERAAGLTKEERRKKVYAVGIGAVIGSATWLKGLTELFEKEPEVREVVGGLTPEDIRDAVNKGLTIPPELLEEPVMPDTSAIEPPLPPEVLEAAEEVRVEVAAPPAEAIPTEAAAEVVTEVKVEAIGVVKKGGSAWQAAKELVDGGKITQEQFAQAWSNPASVVELESGRTIHISELGLTHEGDKVVYVPATETVPAHFAIPEDTLYVGSNEDLAAAFDAAGRPRPPWLNEALEAKLSTYPEVEIDIVGEAGRFEELMPVPQEVIEEAANGNLELAPEALTFDSSSAEFVTDSKGRIVNVIIESRRTAVSNQDVTLLFRDPDLATIKVPSGMPTEMARAQVNADARNLVFLRRLFQKLTEQGLADSDQSAFIKNRIKQIIEKDKIFFGDIYKPEILRQAA